MREEIELKAKSSEAGGSKEGERQERWWHCWSPKDGQPELRLTLSERIALLRSRCKRPNV